LKLDNLTSIFTLGAYQNVDPSINGNQFSGNIYEYMLYKYALSDQAIYQLEGYLAWKWGLNSSLSTANPYYKLRP
jgi:hypothetical protein